MANKFDTPTKSGGKKAYTNHLQTITILNAGNNIPEMTTAEILTARAVEVAASRTFNAFIYNTTTDQLEYWRTTGGGSPMTF